MFMYGIEVQAGGNIKLKGTYIYYNTKKYNVQQIIFNTKKYFKNELKDLRDNFKFSHNHRDHACFIAHDCKRIAIVNFNNVGGYIDINIIGKSDIEHFYNIKTLYKYGSC